MNEVKFGNSVKFTLTDNYMDTIIENFENKDKPAIIILNNLAICSIAERGVEFCFDWAKKNGGVMYLEAPIFKIRAEFYTNGVIVLRDFMGNGNPVRTHLRMFVDYYNEILCKIRLGEKMDNTTEFMDENDKTLNEIKKDYEKTNTTHKDRRDKYQRIMSENDDSFNPNIKTD